MKRIKKPKVRDLNKEITALMGVSLRLEKLSGKVILEKDSDLVMRNLMRLLYHLLCNWETNNLPAITMSDTGGSARTGAVQRSASTTYGREAFMIGGAGDVGDGTLGMLIGTGTTAPTRTDYNLQTKILTSEATHNKQTYELLTDYSFRLNREFTNFTIQKSVSEVGLIYPTTIATVVYNFLYLRDTFTPIVVNIGNGIRARYTFSF